MNIRIILLLVMTFMSGCASVVTTNKSSEHYLEVAIIGQSYVLENVTFSKENEAEFIVVLKEKEGNKLLLKDFLIGDLLKIGPKLLNEGFMLYFRDKNDEIKRISEIQTL